MDEDGTLISYLLIRFFAFFQSIVSLCSLVDPYHQRMSQFLIRERYGFEFLLGLFDHHLPVSPHALFFCRCSFVVGFVFKFDDYWRHPPMNPCEEYQTHHRPSREEKLSVLY